MSAADRPPPTESNVVPIQRRPRLPAANPTTQRPASKGLRALRTRLLEEAAYHGLEVVGKIQGRASRDHVRVQRNVPYLGTGRRSHRLDVYVPEGRTGPLPVVLYIHGGGFMWCSKETHFIPAQAFARAGFVVFNINYRLAPRNPFPAAIEDVCEAALWVKDNAARFNGDASRLVVAGESAGANLVCALTLACCSPRPEPFAKAVYDAKILPRVVIPACGVLQVTEPSRHWARRRLPGVAKRVMHMLPDAYAPQWSRPHYAEELDLVDPLHAFEGNYRFTRPLPGFFVPVGTADPLLDDTRRLAAALHRRGTPHEARYYPGEIHAFHFMLWRKAAQQCWTDTLRFIDQRLSASQLRQVV